MNNYIKLLKTNGTRQIVRKIMKRSLNKLIYIKYKHFFKQKKFKRKEFLTHYTSQMNFFYDIKTKKNIKQFYIKNPLISNEVLKEAETVLNHEFEILGSKRIPLGEIIDWNKDYINSYIWEKNYYKEIEIINYNKTFDVKYPWELSRFNHLFVLGKAYWITDDLKYYIEFKQQIKSWIEQNEFNYSVNWTSTMEVAIRAANLIHSYYHFSDLIENDLEFKEMYNINLYLHGKYIADNLENYDSIRNNHYISNLVGLIYLGFYFKNGKTLREATTWLEKGIKELEKEVKVQINTDGSSFETSTSYHRLVSEFLLYSYILCEINGIKLSENYKEILFKMHKYLIYVTKPNNQSPLIGDIDNGRFIIISNLFWDKRNLNHTLDLFGKYFNYALPKFLHISKEESVWINKKTEDYGIKPSENLIKENESYYDAGIYKLTNNIFFCLVRCGELSMRGQGGHSHNDQLSIELNINGEDFFIDPGSFTYTGSVKERNRDRSTSNHNTLVIKGIEQNTFDDNLFLMQEETFSQVLMFNGVFFKGEHYGYVKKGHGTHTRTIEILNSKFVIMDNLSNKLDHENVFQHFILDPNITIQKALNGIILKKNKVRVFLEVKKVIVEDTTVSYGYGSKIPTKILKIPFQKEISLIVL
ncbi:alginate lyase family protein [Planococcus sp. YIM B11945]|uniref:alginate lyase family protein n=1 Tax=Planococcus sp. YIM B11945 TaxID=3435410 RepID=UPI003D7C4150